MIPPPTSSSKLLLVNPRWDKRDELCRVEKKWVMWNFEFRQKIKEEKLFKDFMNKLNILGISSPSHPISKKYKSSKPILDLLN